MCSEHIWSDLLTERVKDNALAQHAVRADTYKVIPCSCDLVLVLNRVHISLSFFVSGSFLESGFHDRTESVHRGFCETTGFDKLAIGKD